jgi:TonB family protein
MGLKTKWKRTRFLTLPRGREAIMRIALFVSILFHAGILMVVQKAFPINWGTEPLRTYRVELLRPPVDPLDDEDTAGADLAKIKPDEKAPPEDTEDTISLNTKDKKYTSYAAVIKTRLMQHWEYPRQAWENLIEGKVLVLFTLNRQGHLKELKILQPSAYAILDAETERSIRSAAPFPPFPASVTVARLNIKADFTYTLTMRE